MFPYSTVHHSSSDDGSTWHDEGQIWPHLSAAYSLFGSISSPGPGDFFFYGAATPIDEQGELFWFDESQTMKPNKLFTARSSDGREWSDPDFIELPAAGAAEAPGALCVTRSGRWVACFALENTPDPNITVNRRRIIAILSDDEGATWQHSEMHCFEQEHSGGAEAWVIELSDGRLLGTSWHIDHSDQCDHQKEILTADRTVVQSKGERQIADWLAGRGLDYRYDDKMQIIMGYAIRPDFYLLLFDVYIEYWGLTTTDYIIGMHLKKKLYQQEGKKLISIYPDDLPLLDEILTGALRKLGYRA